MWTSKLGNAFPKAEIERDEKQTLARLKLLRKRPENSQCADCGAGSPATVGGASSTGEDVDGNGRQDSKNHQPLQWAVVSLGSFVCVRCASIHRGLGTHVSKVKGLTGTYLWGPDEVAAMVPGNKAVAEIYHGANGGNGDACPTMNRMEALSDAELRTLMRQRYEEKRWFCPLAYEKWRQVVQAAWKGEEKRGGQAHEKPPWPMPSRGEGAKQIISEEHLRQGTSGGVEQPRNLLDELDDAWMAQQEQSCGRPHGKNGMAETDDFFDLANW
eukprot:g3560.t1